jgi:hypothetical protein
MPRRDDGDSVISETGNWNVADDYSRTKIMKPLLLCDYYEDIAMFGYDSIIEELGNYETPPNDIIRIKAMKRLIKQMKRVIDNSKFALRKPGTKKEILKYKEEIVKLENIVPKLVKINYNQQENKKSIVISNLDLFDNVLDKLSDIKSKINEPLNKNHLIFTDKEEFDPKAFKERLKKRMIEKG